MREPFEKFVKAKLGKRLLLIACGLPASWKTETTEEISRLKGYPIVRTDLIRKEVLKGEDIFDEKVAANMDKRLLVYDETFRQADEAVAKKGCAIIDATFISQSLRRRAAAIAAKNGVPFVILQTQCPREVSIARIQKRTRENYESNALTEQAYINNEQKFEAVDLEDLKSRNPTLNIIHLLVDTTSDPPQDWYIIGETRR